MDKVIVIALLFVVVFSCKKDQTEEPCPTVCLTGERDKYVGQWRWVSTVVGEWFDIGPTIYHNYTPQNQGFDYFFILSSSGQYRGYRNGQLIEDYIISSVEFENHTATNSQGMRLRYDCLEVDLNVGFENPSVNQDTLFFTEKPLYFDDQENHLYTIRNYFVRE